MSWRYSKIYVPILEGIDKTIMIIALKLKRTAPRRPSIEHDSKLILERNLGYLFPAFFCKY